MRTVFVVLAIASARLVTAACPTLSSSVYKFDDSNNAVRTLPSGRQYTVHIPAAYVESTPHAAVLSFHGNGGTSAKQATLTQLSDAGMKINGKGIIAVYPQASTGTTGEASWQGAPYAAANANDIGFTRDILDELNENLCIDTSRVYASGKSNGGGFTNLLACTPSTNSRIAAFGLVSGAYYPNTLPASPACAPGRVTPVLISHGWLDATIPYIGRAANANGNTNYRTPNLDEFAQGWATRNGLSATGFVSSAPYADAKKRVWGAAGSAGQVIAFNVTDLDHSWPTTGGLDTSGKPNNVAKFDLTKMDLIPFFDTHTLP